MHKHNSARVNEAKSNGGGLHYCIEVYYPLVGGHDGDSKEEQNNIRRQTLRENYLVFKQKLENMNAVVRAYYV